MIINWNTWLTSYIFILSIMTHFDLSWWTGDGKLKYNHCVLNWNALIGANVKWNSSHEWVRKADLVCILCLCSMRSVMFQRVAWFPNLCTVQQRSWKMRKSNFGPKQSTKLLVCSKELRMRYFRALDALHLQFFKRRVYKMLWRMVPSAGAQKWIHWRQMFRLSWVDWWLKVFKTLG